MSVSEAAGGGILPGMRLLQPLTPPPADFGARLQDSVAQLGTLVPNLLAALVILFSGYLLAKLIQRGVARVLLRLRLNEALARGGVTPAVERAGGGVNPARLLATLVFWCVMFAVLLVAANALGLKSLADVFAELVGYIPSVIAAVVIVIAGILLGGFVEGLIRASAGTIHGGPTLARVARVGVVVIAVFMALQELGVATEIVTTAFAILFGAVALALALSFGLGNRELAGEVTRVWYERYRAERAAIDREQALEAAEDEAELARPVGFRRTPRAGAPVLTESPRIVPENAPPEAG